jgi:hypothetical protein
MVNYLVNDGLYNFKQQVDLFRLVKEQLIAWRPAVLLFFCPLGIGSCYDVYNQYGSFICLD